MLTGQAQAMVTVGSGRRPAEAARHSGAAPCLPAPAECCCQRGQQAFKINGTIIFMMSLN